MKNFISMFLMTSLLLGGMTFTIGKMSVCAASKNRIETAQQKQAHLFGSAKNKLAATDPDFAQTMDNFIYRDALLILLSISTAVHSGIVTPVVS